MKNFIERNWARWNENIAPMIVAKAEEAKNAMRRATVKMNDDDPDEETKTAA